jgi:GTP-dependent phosphoenolpyruvate carboxykinase
MWITSPARFPRYGDLNRHGLAFDRLAYRRMTDIRREAAQGEVEGVRTWFAKLGTRLPKPVADQLAEFAKRVAAMPETWRAE